MEVEREAALHRGLADDEEPAGVPVLDRDVAERLELSGVVEPLGEVGEKREREIGRADAVEGGASRRPRRCR